MSLTANSFFIWVRVTCSLEYNSKSQSDASFVKLRSHQNHPPDRQCPVSFPAIHLSLGHGVPTEVELPVEASVGHVRSSHVFESVIADHVNDGAHHRSPAANTHTHPSARWSEPQVGRILEMNCIKQ